MRLWPGLRMLALSLTLTTGLHQGPLAAEPAATSPRLSVQLWSIKEDMARDFDGSLQRLAAMGLQGIEFSGYFGPYAKDPEGLKTRLDQLGLKTSSAHVRLSKLNAEHFDDTVAFYKALNCSYLIIPGDSRASTLEGAEALARDLDELQRRLTPHGMRIGYHNHQAEMLGEPGKTPWDVIGARTSPAVILQQDVGWTKAAGKDPVERVKAYPGRTVLTHFKAAAPQPGQRENAIIGRDSTDWPSLIRANRTVGGTLWFVLEQEVHPEGSTPMQSLEASLRGLQDIMAKMKP